MGQIYLKATGGAQVNKKSIANTEERRAGSGENGRKSGPFESGDKVLGLSLFYSLCFCVFRNTHISFLIFFYNF